MTRVRWIQSRVQANGFSPGAVDGRMGPNTRRAVRQFQAANHLKVDGIVGDQTWAALMSGPEVTGPAEVLSAERQALLDVLAAEVGVPGTVEQVLRSAIETLGWREAPDGSNDGPEVGQISSGYFSAEDEDTYGKPPWCALAISYWLREGLAVGDYSATPFGRRFGAVAQIEAWAKREDRFTVARAGREAPVGAIFTMSRSGSGSDPSTAIRAGHTGFVLRNDGSRVVTLEGNTSNAVKSRSRRKTTLRGWVRWW